MKKRIKEIFEESIAVKKETIRNNVNAIEDAAAVLIDVFKNGGKLILFGNGGSAADSQHIAAEFIGRFQKERKSLPAIALTTDTSILTALGNDYGFDIIFSRQLEGLGRKNDVAMVFSTSGNSKNVIEAVKTARKIGIKTISLTGNDGGKLAALTDIKIIVPSKITARIQEAHGLIAHALCELAEEALSG